ncbi:hypothetical protein [Moraxella sp. Pampa]|uniref:hypothetical protein n=1 Tax=Moraxella sp. Pampa TaxID=3111978 RepID=UPI002B415D7A|nr:hypothetical protein [Moraxella sp. Pampa]
MNKVTSLLSFMLISVLVPASAVAGEPALGLTKQVNGYTVGCFSEGQSFVSEKTFDLCKPDNTRLILDTAAKTKPNFGGGLKAIKVHPFKEKDTAMVVFVDEKKKTIKPDDRVYVVDEGSIGSLHTRKDSFVICFDTKDDYVAATAYDNQTIVKGGCSYATRESKATVSTNPLITGLGEVGELGLKVDKSNPPERDGRFKNVLHERNIDMLGGDYYPMSYANEVFKMHKK